jgi:hypothetical protein
LSNSPEIRAIPSLRRTGEPPKPKSPTETRHPTEIGCLVTTMSEVLRRRVIAPKGGRRAVVRAI